MSEPEKLTSTLPIADRTLSTIESLRPMMLSMRWALKARLHANGWADVPIKDVDARMYFVGGAAHLVALHRPTGIDGVLMGGAEDGAHFPVDGHAPALTVGIISGTDPDDFFGCDCYSCHDDACSPPEDEDAWTCWRLDGLAQGGDGVWRWGYVPADSFGITRREQQMHDSGSAHNWCSLCRLENWLTKSSSSRLPPMIKPRDATLHIESTPHAGTSCTACKAALGMGALC